MKFDVYANVEWTWREYEQRDDDVEANDGHLSSVPSAVPLLTVRCLVWMFCLAVLNNLWPNNQIIAGRFMMLFPAHPITSIKCMQVMRGSPLNTSAFFNSTSCHEDLFIISVPLTTLSHQQEHNPQHVCSRIVPRFLAGVNLETRSANVGQAKSRNLDQQSRWHVKN